MDEFSNFYVVFCLYIRISLKFIYIIIYNKICPLPGSFRDWSLTLLLKIAKLFKLLLLLDGNVHKNPGPLSICHWNLGGFPTDNFLKKTLLHAFLCVNNFDIIVLGESHLTSKINDNDLEIDGYSFERCDHPDDVPRGGIIIYYKSSLPCIFKPELTNLRETLVLQVKIDSKKCFFTCTYRNPSSENNIKHKVDEYVIGLNSTLDNIKGKNPYINFLIGDFNAKKYSVVG